jgi:hypothetical protein
MCGFKEADISNFTSFAFGLSADFKAGLPAAFIAGLGGAGTAGLSAAFIAGLGGAGTAGLSATFITGLGGAGTAGLSATFITGLGGAIGAGLIVFLANSPFVINRFVDGSKTILLKSGLKIIQGLLLILFYLYIKFLFFLET